MKDNDKHGFGTFGAIVLGVTAVATAIVAVSKSKKKKQSLNSFLKDELVKLPLFSKDESHHAKKSVADEDDIFVDEDNEPQNDKTTSFYDEEISYEEDEEFQPVSKAKPIVDFKPKHEEAEKPAEAQDAAGEPEAEPDDTFVFESVVVGRESVKDEPVDISDKKLDREFIAEPVDAEPVRDNFVLNDEDFSEEVQEIEIDDVTAEPAEEKVTELEKEDGPVSAGKYDDVSSEAETAKEAFASAVETPVRETFSDVEFFDEEEDTEEGLRNNESYYDWTYNVDEHYSVITDGTWVYCKSDDVLISDSINKKDERETIDIADTFKNRIKTKGYCLLKYIGTDREVIVPDTINGKPVVAALNTFRSNQIVKKVILPSTMQGLRRTFYSCYHLDSITFAPGTNLVYELDAIMCGNNDMDSNTEATTVYCSHAIAEYIKGHYRLGCPVTFVEK
ncbi:MAG: hypothetical protein SOY46_02040 [Butyrivibrio crossotus]|nr:hypothetical protein [Butyrivibrio crossotus]